MRTGHVERAVCFFFLEAGVSLSPKPCLVITAVEQHVTITFKTERSLWTETPNYNKIKMLPQLKTLSHLSSYSYRLQSDWNRTGSSRLQPRCQNKCFLQKCPFWWLSMSTKINGQIIPHQLQLTEKPFMKVLALTSPFNVVYMIYLLKLRSQVSTSVSL